MAINFHPWYELTERQIIKEIGKRLKEFRLHQNITQKRLGEMIGKGPDEISKIESGKPVTMTTFLRVLRALNKLEYVDKILEPPKISPLKLRELELQKRKRASKTSNK
ncbi:helix-turn-helix domain-containing protein [Sunxiuqinia rutila]|uniref:helix-turn-helix domain-containing protein n=1 Tax=Sunxiuqinia rutila TaxID=1397841 RepID=UPI003D3617E0